ncbi:MAG: lipopolysaccharide heptosyltransferase II [candidate division KSB1 bacterium]|nr:lipopolysaccharide heptosyltransferase II [candidate division KSB1 bacterium]
MPLNGKPPQRILIIRLSAIGDILLTTPLLRALRNRFPHTRLDFVVKSDFAELLHYHPAITQLYKVDPHAGWSALRALGRQLRKQRYELVFDIHNNFRSRYLTAAACPQRVLRYRKHVFRRWMLVRTKINWMKTVPPVSRRYLDTALPLGIGAEQPQEASPLELFWREQEEREATTTLTTHGWEPDMPLIALAPGAGYFTKRWPAAYFGQFAAALAQLGNQLVLLGGPQEAEVAKEVEKTMKEVERSARQHNGVFEKNRVSNVGGLINLVGKLSLLAAAAVIKRCRLLITNDSGPMHIAEAVGTPLVAIFGSTVREFGFFPQNATSHVVEHEGLSCRPCSHLGHDRCPRGHFRCMREILPETVLAIAQQLLTAREVTPICRLGQTETIDQQPLVESNIQ